MIAISVVHRRLAELTIKARQVGGYDRLAKDERIDLHHCLQVNAALVIKMDELKQLSFIAYQSGDLDWQHSLCAQLDKLEATCL